MVLVWIGIGIGILIAIILAVKLTKTPSHEALKAETRCKICGNKISGFRCPRCSKQSSFGR